MMVRPLAWKFGDLDYIFEFFINKLCDYESMN